MNQYDLMLIIMAMETKFDIDISESDMLIISNTKMLVETVIRLLKQTGRYVEEHKTHQPRHEKVKLVDSPEETFDPSKESTPDEEDPEEMKQVAEAVESSIAANLKIPKDTVYTVTEKDKPSIDAEEKDPEPPEGELETPEPLLDSGADGEAIRNEMETERTIVISDPEEETK